MDVSKELVCINFCFGNNWYKLDGRLSAKTDLWRWTGQFPASCCSEQISNVTRARGLLLPAASHIVAFCWRPIVYIRPICHVPCTAVNAVNRPQGQPMQSIESRDKNSCHLQASLLTRSHSSSITVIQVIQPLPSAPDAAAAICISLF